MSRTRAVMAAVALGIVFGLGGCSVSADNQGSGSRPDAATISTLASDEQTAGSIIEAVSPRPGWTEVSVAPSDAVEAAALSIGGKNLRAATRFWTTGGSADDQAAWVIAHPPPGYRLDASGALGGPGGGPSRSVLFRSRVRPSTGTQAAIAFTIASDRGVVEIRADAQVGPGANHF